MQAQGVVLDEGGDVPGDYALLVTSDPAVAERFGFEPEDVWDGELGSPDDAEDGVAASR
jgi:hypothetical protein